jgi:hypothetical protein
VAGEQETVPVPVPRPGRVPETVTAFAVQEVVHAGAEHVGQVVRVRQVGPVPAGMWVEDAEMVAVPGERYLLFLVPSPQPGIYSIVGGGQDIFRVAPSDDGGTLETGALTRLPVGESLGTALQAIRAAR